MLLNTEKRIHVRLRETEVERKKKKNPFSGAARAQVRPTFSLRIGSREERRPRDRLLVPWAEGRGPDEENEEDERLERGTDRSARERNPRLPWLPSHSRLASLPWRWRHPFPRCLFSLLSSPLFSLSRFLCSVHMPTDTLTLARFRPPRSRAPIFSPTTRGDSLSRARFVLSSRRVPLLHGEREVEREEQTEETARVRVRMRDTWSFAISRLDASPERFDHLSNVSHSQPRNVLSRDAYLLISLWRLRGILMPLKENRHDVAYYRIAHA